MERRLILAISLMIVVAVVPSFFIKQKPRPAATTRLAPESAAAAPNVRAATPQAGAPISMEAPTAAVAATGDTVSLGTPRATYSFSTIGAGIARAEFPAYLSYGAGQGRAPVNLVRDGDRLLAYRLVVGADTVRLDNLPF
jgi:YidC/Oxa1 family membrane protein insertase